ncbi:MAG: biotin/lipoyl-binding protein, partial [Cyanobacteriota bacterium]|nr:biotin/lipoyl-binding protein [Cyanobacteriota bacterium]
MLSPSNWEPPDDPRSKSTEDQRDRMFAISDSEDVVLQQSRFWARGITWALMGVTAFALGWLALAKTEEIVTAPGKLEPLGVVKEIRMPVGGVVDEILVKEGEQVQKGQVLLKLDTEATKDRQQSLLSSIDFKTQQLGLKVEELRRYLDVNDTEQRMLVRSLGLEQEVLDRLEVLNR